MSREDEQVIIVLNKYKVELRSQREARAREEGKLGQIKKSLNQEIGTEDIKEAEDLLKELLNKMANKRKEAETDFMELCKYYGI